MSISVSPTRISKREFPTPSEPVTKSTPAVTNQSTGYFNRCYCKVPDEIFTVQADSNSQRAGEVHFEYGEEMSPIMGSEFPIRPYENLLLIFPASLKHHVPSYWVDAERVSVSGNFIVI